MSLIASRVARQFALGAGLIVFAAASIAASPARAGTEAQPAATAAPQPSAPDHSGCPGLSGGQRRDVWTRARMQTASSIHS